MTGQSPAPTPAGMTPAPQRTQTLRASPAVRRLAREFGVDLALVRSRTATDRITQTDVLTFIREAMQSGNVPGAPLRPRPTLALAPWPRIDASHFGAIEARERSPEQVMHSQERERDRVLIPQVTSFDEADVTELERFRQKILHERGMADAELPLNAFLIHACADALRRFPEFNASFEADAGHAKLVLKRRVHIGFTVFTDTDMKVAVIRDADRLTLTAIAQRVTLLSREARDGALTGDARAGAGFTLANLGELGGTGYMPAIHAPEVARLGVSRADLRPSWNGIAFEARRILPLSLSWDHRVIDGVLAARFLVHLAQCLSDFRKLLT